MDQKSSKQINLRNMLISDAMEKYPGIEIILISYGLGCVGCAFSGSDTIEQGAKIHGMMDEDFNMMLKDIKTFISKMKFD